MAKSTVLVNSGRFEYLITFYWVSEQLEKAITKTKKIYYKVNGLEFIIFHSWSCNQFFLFFGSFQIYVQEMGEICSQIIIHGWLVCAAAVNEYNSFDCNDYVTCYSLFATWAVKFVIAKISDSGIRIYIYPVLGVLIFLPRNFLNFWHLLPRFCKFFQDRGKKSKKIFGLLGTKTKNIHNLGKRTKKYLGFLAKKSWISCQKILDFLPKNLGFLAKKSWISCQKS